MLVTFFILRVSFIPNSSGQRSTLFIALGGRGEDLHVVFHVEELCFPECEENAAPVALIDAVEPHRLPLMIIFCRLKLLGFTQFEF